MALGEWYRGLMERWAGLRCSYCRGRIRPGEAFDVKFCSWNCSERDFEAFG